MHLEMNELDEEHKKYLQYLHLLVGNKYPLRLVQTEFPIEVREDHYHHNLHEEVVWKGLVHDGKQAFLP